MKSVCCRPCAFFHRQSTAPLSAVTSAPLDPSVHHHFSWDTTVTHDQSSDCYSATTFFAVGISVSFWTWMNPQTIPDAFIPDAVISLPPTDGFFCTITASEWKWAYDVVTTKPPFSLAVSMLFYCYCPQAQWVLSALLALNLPSAERRHLSDGAIFSSLANSPLLVLTVMHCD